MAPICCPRAMRGDPATKLVGYRARIDEVPGDVTRFLELLQQAMGSEPALFKLSIMES
jgi:hypothetical protein